MWRQRTRGIHPPNWEEHDPQEAQPRCAGSLLTSAGHTASVGAERSTQASGAPPSARRSQAMQTQAEAPGATPAAGVCPTWSSRNTSLTTMGKRNQQLLPVWGLTPNMSAVFLLALF